MLNVIEDYLNAMGYSYERIDGDTKQSARQVGEAGQQSSKCSSVCHPGVPIGVPEPAHRLICYDEKVALLLSTCRAFLLTPGGQDQSVSWLGQMDQTLTTT
jgi:hypothetical protein